MARCTAFEQYGKEPMEGHVMLDKATGRSRGFGFVTFANKEDMDECIAKLHGTELDGRKISVTRAIPQSEIAPGAPVGRGGSYSGGGGRDRCACWHQRSLGCLRGSAPVVGRLSCH